MSSKATQERNIQRHSFLLTFFEKIEGYKVKEVNGFVLVKQWNGANSHWEVAIHTKESWEKVKEWKESLLEK
jgi:hypothetical protein